MMMTRGEEGSYDDDSAVHCRVQRVLGHGLVEASEARSLDEAEAMFFSSLLESLYYYILHSRYPCI